jgi:hypothetical protein
MVGLEKKGPWNKGGSSFLDHAINLNGLIHSPCLAIKKEFTNFLS